MNSWLNDEGCEIFFEELVAIDEHGNMAAGRTYSWWCRCGFNREQYEHLAECVSDARRHIERIET